MKKSKKVAVVSPQCVACGCCEKVCPVAAIKVMWGVRAKVNGDVCIGCGKCAKACPAQVIDIIERNGAYA